MTQAYSSVEAIPESDAYEVDAPLAHGGMGAIYRGRRRQDDQTVVLKSVVGLDREIPRFLLHEYEILRDLHHPNIIRVFDLFRIDNQVFIAAEYFNGIEATRAIEPPVAGNQQACEWLVIVLAQIFDAVMYLHQRKIMHGEMAPTNILIDEDLHVKIVDFELARRLDHDESDLWEPGTITGIPKFMAPEQLRGDPPEIASDIFALGIALFEWLYGQPVFDTSREFREIIQQRLKQKVDSAYLSARGASSGAAKVLSKMLAFEVAERSCDHKQLFLEIRSALTAGGQLKGTVGKADQAVSRAIEIKPTESLQPEHRWDVALSFAGADRQTAAHLATHLKNLGLRVFYDVDHQSDLLGEDLFSTLQDVYTRNSKYCVLLISQHYQHSDWAWFESRNVLRKAMAQRSTYVLPVRIDDSSLPGLPESIAYLDLRTRSVEEVADTIANKVRKADRNH